MSTDLKLLRYTSGQKGTFGVMVRKDVPFCLTLEPENPIIPKGIYTLEKYFSPKFQKNVFLFNNVSNHTSVEIHTGNTVKDTEGCLLVANEIGNEGFLIGSVETLKKIFSIYPDTFTLEVI